MKIKKLVLGGLLIALNLILPYVFHFIPNGGKLFLPMHIGVLIAGLLLGAGYGAAVGAVSPFLGFLITQMPQMPTAVFMSFELAAYGACSGFFIRLFREKCRLNEFASTYLSLLLSMAAGRLVYAGVLLLSGLLAVEKAPAAAVVFTSFLTGLPGVAVQLVFVPAIVVAVRKLTRFDRKREQAMRY